VRSRTPPSARMCLCRALTLSSLCAPVVQDVVLKVMGRWHRMCRFCEHDDVCLVQQGVSLHEWEDD